MPKRNASDLLPQPKQSRKTNAAAKNSRNNSFEANTQRTILVNTLASEINRSFNLYWNGRKSRDFYQRISSKMRKEPMNHPFFMIRKLRSMELHHRYISSHLSHSPVSWQLHKNGDLEVTLEAHCHSTRAYKERADSYYYKLILLSWQKNKLTATHTCQLSDWVPVNEQGMGFEFEFQLPPSTTFWLLAVGQSLCEKKSDIPRATSHAMHIEAVETLVEEDAELAKIMDAEEAMQIKNSINKISTEPRVRAKKLRP